MNKQSTSNMSHGVTTTVQQNAATYRSCNRGCSTMMMAAAQDRLAYNSRIESMRRDEYPMLKDQVYLDHAGMTLPSRRLVDNFAKSMTSNIISNPHSAYAHSQRSTPCIEDIRSKALQLFDADPEHFDLIFVANATAGVKLVAEVLRAVPGGFDYLYHQSSHTSLVGLRQEAGQSVCIDDAATAEWLAGGSMFSTKATSQQLLMFSFPAQSNLDGSRLPLDWIRQSRSRDTSQTCLTLLDAAAYVSSSPLSLSVPEDAPDFTVFSFYKMFGFPDLGGLIVRRESTSKLLLNRKYFGGGTVEAVTCDQEEAWHVRSSRSLHEALEDGTLPVHSICALGIAMKTHVQLFGSMAEVSLHTSYLADRLHSELRTLRHENGTPLCVLYSSRSGTTDGPIVAFNLLTDMGAWVSPSKFQELAILKGFHIRTGGVCNPGGIAAALELNAADVKDNFAQGYRCGGENDMFRGRPVGVIRVSFGAMSTLSDVARFSSFVQEFYITRSGVQRTWPWDVRGSGRILSETTRTSVYAVKSIVVFPIKSCQGFAVPQEASWAITAKGLVWDREWCLLNRATNRVMNQKRYPRMALLQPHIDIADNTLTICYRSGSGTASDAQDRSISVPLCSGELSSAEERQIDPSPSQVTGVDGLVHRYNSETVNAFFSTVLETPCALARISHPCNKSRTYSSAIMPGTFPIGDDEATLQTRGSLSNESPMLAINMSSVNHLNRQIQLAGGEPVPVEAFRANIILDLTARPAPGSAVEAPYSEDGWSQLRLAGLRLNVLGPCQRCHMVCIDPWTGIKRPEPFVTLSRTRRVAGKVLFGCHLALASSSESEAATLKTGDLVIAEFR